MPQRPARGIRYDGRARGDLADGINLVARVVSGTLGPHGRVVMMDSRFGTPEISVSAMDSKAGAPVLGNDGYAIAREILTSNTYRNQGVFLARDAAKMAKRGTGDGSTTAIVLSDAMVRGGLRVVMAGHEPVSVTRGMQAAAEQVCAGLAARSVRAESVAQLEVVGRQAAGDVEIGRAVAEAVERVGSDNVLLEEGGHEAGVTVDVDESFSIKGGYLDPNLIPDRGAAEAVLQDALVFVSSVEVSDMRAFSRVLEVCQATGRPLLAVATGFGADVLAMITVNGLNRRATCVPVVAPGHGVTRSEVLEDLAVFTGATVVDQAGLVVFGKAHAGALGSAGRVVVGRATTTVHDGGADPQMLRLRVAALASDARDADSLHDRDLLEARRSRLAGAGCASVRIGAPTDVERRERFRRGLDALAAVKRAVASGVVPGGGAALLRAGASLEAPKVNGHGGGEAAGFEVMRRACEEPARVLARNGGWDVPEVVGRLRAGREWLAFDTVTGREVDGVDAGIVDPVDVVSHAVMVATSTAITVLRSSVVIAQPLSGGRYAGTVAEGGPANLTLK
ncbi:MAG: chaperonin GroEL [Gaiellales bacterium]|jgi:chaperonin GroEL|nr:chaperonin GroEL [Gaiellales bacterium]